MKYFNSFDLFMESFRDRHKEDFKGPGAEKVDSAPAKPILVRQESLKEHLVNVEEIDWKKRAAADEDPWDGQEPTDD